MNNLEKALDLITAGRRKSNVGLAWSLAQEAAELAGVEVHRDPRVSSRRGWPDFERLEADVRAALAPQFVIVSRHAGAVEWLRRKGIEGEVITHITDPSAVAGKIVVGNLPMHLAAAADRVGVIEMPDLPAEKRGVDLTADEMEEFGARLSWYRVESLI